MPRVSVVMASYNHAPFIREAMESVLGQTVADLELIVVDDASRDRSNAVIAGVDDPRVRHIPLPQNVGACAAMNTAIDLCTGEFVAVCNSDDIWVKDKLERQLCVIAERSEVGAVFSDVTWINDDGEELEDRQLSHGAGIFAQPNRSRSAWLRTLVEQGNCLCHPSVLIRREVYDRVGTLNNLLRQLPDHDFWLRVLRVYDIHVMPDRLVKFRIHTGNTSAASPVNDRRVRRETFLITKDFFGSLTAEEFYTHFANQSKAPVGMERLLGDKVEYLSKIEQGPDGCLLDVAIDLAYTASRRDGVEIVPALQFQALTGRGTDRPLWHAVKQEAKQRMKRVPGVLYGISVLKAVRWSGKLASRS